MTTPFISIPGVSDLNEYVSPANLVKLLKKRGVSQAEITHFIATKTPTAKISAILTPTQISQVVAGQNPTRASESRSPFGSNPDFSGVAQGFSKGVAESQGIAPTGTGQTNVFNKSAPTAKATSGLGASIGGGIGLGGLNTKKTSSGLGASIGSGLSGLGKIGSSPVANTDGATMDNPFPTDLGGAAPYTAPVITPRDFTSEAQGMAANAYAPFYQAIAAGKTNANQQYSTSDQVVKGLYDKLVADTQASGAAQSAQYDQSSTEAAARSKALQDRQAQVYGESANSQAELMKSLGQQVSAQDVLSGGAQEQAFQQSQAAQQGTAQQDYYGASKQAAQDYTTGTGNAQNTAGTVAREDLVRDLSDVLSQYDQQSAQGKVQEGTTALSIANSLTDRDLSAQTANANNQQGAYSLNQNASQAALAAQQDAWKTQYQVGQDRQAQSNTDRAFQYQKDSDKANIIMQMAQAQGESGATSTALKFDDLDPVTQIQRQADESDPGKGTQYTNMFNALVNAPDTNLDDMNPQTFGVKAAQVASQYGLSPGVAFAAAVAYYQKVMNRK